MRNESHWKGRGNGKLLITGEYFVLDGAAALAIPTRLGQEMEVWENGEGPARLRWQSYDREGRRWFEGLFSLPDLELLETTDTATADRLRQIFQAIDRQRPGFWRGRKGMEAATRLEFPRLWGLGTSSTLLVNLANWSRTDPFQLLADSFTGSGYDIACGLSEQPLLYQVDRGRPHYVQLPYHPPFADQLFFVYLEKKQDSRAGIARYRERVERPADLIKEISELTLSLLQAGDLGTFEQVIRRHEALIARALDLPRVQESLFSDFWGQIKSLGAWGGDFALAASDRSAEATREFFNTKGYSVVLSYKELLL